MYEKLKSLLTDDAFFFTILLILVGISSFGLGRQSVTEQAYNPTAVESVGVVYSEPDKQEVVIQSNSVRVVASRSGARYYLLDCSGVSRIKEENKIYFDSIELAAAAGYTPAANCPGLK